jgi:hypothetical protein
VNLNKKSGSGWAVKMGIEGAFSREKKSAACKNRGSFDDDN